MSADSMIQGCRVIITCFACPEQYDVFLGDKQIGYLRLRWSHFTADYPDVDGECVYEATIGDSGWDGRFKNDEQRYRYLNAAVAALLEKAIRTIPSRTPK
jgi:hypothetical protein